MAAAPWLLGLSILWLADVSSAQGCGGRLTSLRGTILSPNFPNNYTNGLNCITIITAPANYRITLTINVLDIEPEPACLFDSLEIRDGSSATSPRLGRFCDKATTKILRRTFTNQMWINFTTDTTVTAQGFNANYESALIRESLLLITTNAGSILRMDPDTVSNYPIPFPGRLRNPIAVDFDPVERRVYWTQVNVDSNVILSSKLNGAELRLVRNAGPNAIMDGLAVDSQSRNVFATDTGNNNIVMISMTNFAIKTIISTNLDQPRAIVLDTTKGVLFWTDWGLQPKIERANYDGSDRRTLFNSNINTINALALDVPNNKLYWADAYTDRVERSDMNGNGRTTLLQLAGFFHFFGMTLLSNSLYITDWGTDGSRSNFTQVIRYNLATSTATLYGTAPVRMNGIHGYQAPISATPPNGCGTNKGGCSVFCIPLPGNSRKCACPDGQQLAADRTSCSKTG